MGFAKTTIVSVGILAAALAISPVGAKIFKHVDEYGNVSYSDKPAVGSEEVSVRGAKTSKADAEREGDESPSAGEDDDGEPENVEYKSLEILTPRQGKIVDPATGTVQVILLPTPSLGKSDELIINIDGRDVSKGRDVNLSVQNLPNGNHTVSSRIQNSDGKVVIESASVKFKIGEKSR